MKIEISSKRHGVHWAFIDDESFELIKGYKWNLSYSSRSGSGIKYAQTRKPGGGTIRMHRLIIGAPIGVWVDHRNGDGLDNRKTNLRLCTPSQNNANRKTSGGRTSKFLGVCFDKSNGKFRAGVRHNWKRYRKFFRSEIEAAKWYNKKALELHGEFARLNKV